jgi:hypothetical protein
MRPFAILLVVLMGLGAAAVYDMKYDTSAAAARVSALEAELTAARDRNRVLEADHATLSSNQRLQALANSNAETLNLSVAQSSQFRSLDSIPERPAPALDDILGLR